MQVLRLAPARQDSLKMTELGLGLRVQLQAVAALIRVDSLTAKRKPSASGVYRLLL